jgi:hypothetical protein
VGAGARGARGRDHANPEEKTGDRDGEHRVNLDHQEVSATCCGGYRPATSHLLRTRPVRWLALPVPPARYPTTAV